MMSFRFFIFLTAIIFSYSVAKTSAHAYFSYPTPRNAYCANLSCTTNGSLGFQGPAWTLPRDSSLATASLTTQTTCNGSAVFLNASSGNTYDPGFQGVTSATWTAGSMQTFRIFISQIHSPENQTVYPTDGWQIRYRDGTQSNSTFAPIAFTYVNVSNVSSAGPAPAIGFRLGQTVLATITVPSVATTDGIFQFYWRNNEVGPGAMWLSCVDVTIVASDSTTTSAALFMVFTALFVNLACKP